MKSGWMLLFLGVFLSGCADLSAAVQQANLAGYGQVNIGPFTINVNSSGEVQLGVKTQANIPLLPFISIEAGLYATPAEHFDLPYAVIIRYGGKDFIFNLAETQTRNLSFSNIHAGRINFWQSGHNLFIEILPYTCNGMMSRFFSDIGRVSSDVNLRNNVRRFPSRSAELLGQLNIGTQFRIVGGPMCNEGYIWWEIEGPNYQGGTVRGWTAEGDGQRYYLEPISQ
ncbi:MAG: SH3 domain-containing protein [Anaerolineae bacterium]|nr:SH3 domain-containing protein [Anaerolineae bacterium]